MKTKKITYKQLMNYIEQLELQVQNNQKAVYDVSGLLNEYVEMKKDVKKLQNHMQKRFGSDAEIPTRWSVFSKFIKNKYLQLKKVLVFGK
jgi:hypothetical protein|tara:strand:+ start:184 stop:453 length:270 start_codon:yes stop_codon:yes gene_type:complete